jgi:hypothetical protein
LLKLVLHLRHQLIEMPLLMLELLPKVFHLLLMLLLHLRRLLIETPLLLLELLPKVFHLLLMLLLHLRRLLLETPLLLLELLPKKFHHGNAALVLRMLLTRLPRLLEPRWLRMTWILAAPTPKNRHVIAVPLRSLAIAHRPANPDRTLPARMAGKG